jgi:ATP/maltotriose-dependent transcriptional regulator MalT
MLARRTERISKRVLASCKPIVWITGVAGTGKTRILQALRKKLKRGSSAPVWTLLDDPDAEHFESALTFVGSGDRDRQRRIVVATRPNGAAVAALRKPRVYGLVEVIEDAELFLSARDGGGTGSSQVLELTGGWPVLADAFASGRATELLPELPNFLQTEVLPTLPPSVVVALFVVLTEPLNEEAVRELLRGQASSTPLLRHTAQGLSTASTWVAGALLHLRQRPNSFSKETLDRILDFHARFGRPDKSIPALLAMGQPTQALAVFERAGGPFFGYLRGFHALETLLDLFGPELEQRTDALLFARLWFLLKQGRPREALLRLEARYPALPVDLRRLRVSHRPYALLVRLVVSEDLDESPPIDVVMSWSSLETMLPAADILARGMVYNSMAIAFLRSDHLLQARQLAHEALAAYERAQSPYLAHFMEVHLADVALRQSRLRDATAHLQRARELLSASGLTFNTEPVVIDFFAARLAYEEGRFEDCPAQMEPTLQALLQGDSWPGLILTIAAYIAFAAFWRHGLRAALEAIEQCVLTLGRRHGTTPDRGLAIMRIRLYQIARRHAEAAVRLEELDLEPAQSRSAHGEIEEGLVRLRCHIAQHRTDKEAEGLLKALSSRPNLEARHKISLAILQASLHHRAVEYGLARRQLNRALRSAETLGLLGVLIEEGEFLERLLPVLIADPGPGNEGLVALAKRVVRLLRTLPSTALHSKSVAGISRQEHRVLSYLTDGYTNKEIARALVLSESAVKFHLRNLFKKLRVSSRSALVAAARRRGIST